MSIVNDQTTIIRRYDKSSSTTQRYERNSRKMVCKQVNWVNNLNIYSSKQEEVKMSIRTSTIHENYTISTNLLNNEKSGS